MSSEISEEKPSSSGRSSAHTCLMESGQYPSPSALMAALTASLAPYYAEPNRNETPPLSSSSSSSLNTTPNSKKKGLSDVISKLHRAASHQTTPNKSGDESTENEEPETDDHHVASHELSGSQQKLLDLLTRANLTQYFPAFIAQGGDDIDQLCDANDAEFKEICDLVNMSCKPLHVKRLKKALEELKNTKSEKVGHSVQRFLPEQSISLSLPTPNSTSSSSSASSTTSNSSFTISKLFGRSESPTSQNQGLLTTGAFLPLYQMMSNQKAEEKKEEESEEDETYDEYADTDDVEEEDDEDDEEPKAQPQSSIKIEQNEKMIKKNKVIELYTKGERCVRKLSQLTGVPLTTVYRVIGKLKGINYNIPRGNGAGRKTILDAQDREILVEILNKQPRISRKALGKELEKLTGKSIHNSTLNRELCRLRYQNNGSQSQPTDNYMKHFKKPKKFEELTDECLKIIQAESKRYGSQMSQSEFECKPLLASLSANLSKQIIEICQMSTNLSQSSSQQLQQLKLDKIKQSLVELLGLGDGFYEKCLYEVSVQLCLQKPTLLTRHEDLLNHAKKILESLQIVDDLKSKIKRSASCNLDQEQKKVKLEETQTPQNNLQTPFNLYTAALALHLQQGQNFDLNSYLVKLRMNLYHSQQESLRSLMEKNEIELKHNLKKQEELRLKLFGLSMSNVNNEQIRIVYEGLQTQLAELIRRHAQLLSEQARLKSQDISSQSDMRTYSSDNENISQTNDVNENIDVLK